MFFLLKGIYLIVYAEADVLSEVVEERKLWYYLVPFFLVNLIFLILDQFVFLSVLELLKEKIFAGFNVQFAHAVVLVQLH